MQMSNTEIKNIEQIKKAIEVEIKHHYINIQGKKQPFSRFIIGELRTISKQFVSNPKWKRLIDVFERYAFDDVSNRIKAIKLLISSLQNPEDTPLKTKKAEIQKDSQNPEDVDVTYVKGVGPKIASVFNKIGIYTASDLISYYPKKHLDYSTRTNIIDLKEGENANIFGIIKSVSTYNSKSNDKLTIINVTVADETASISISMFYARVNRYMLERYKAQYPKGANVIINGVVKFDKFKGELTIDKPQTTIISAEFDNNSTQGLHTARLVPIYSLTDKLNAKVLRRAIYNALTLYSAGIKELMPDSIKAKYNLMDKKDAVFQIHFPDNEDLLNKARHTLVFEELFIVQLRLAYMRNQNKKTLESVQISLKEDGLVKKFLKSLPFELTNGQNNAFEEILNDLNSTEPMQRLLQGDVGSGKTVVACMTLLSAIENNYQGAIMAPTEILAEQHYKNFVQWLTPLGLSVGLFIGRHGTKTRREMQQNLKNGQMDIAVGTHALIQDGVEFANLGAIVVDEQHRFGVKQRTKLRNKGLCPQMLTMTATPIPRTLALTVHGDLDITVIDELPKGRKPIKTALITGKGRQQVYDLIKEEIKKGHQAYIVFPLIEESETLSAKAATEEAKKLQKGVFSEYKIGLVHGKLAANEKDKVMQEFRDKKYDILVCTTVIEVGVDVPNATVMLIENAERFGLPQLHQLRGRVGRSALQSYCIIATDSKSIETRERLNIMTQTNNGFVIAEKDLELRGPGEFMGTRQSGIPELLLADIVKDAKTLEEARDAAFEFMKNNELSTYTNLYKTVKNKIEEGIDFINAG